jgi:predicted esterase
MRSAVLSLCLLLVFFHISFGRSLPVNPARIAKQTIDSGGKKRAYYLYVPDNVGPKPPLIVTLHGSGRDGLSLVEKWKDLADKEGFILAGPDALGSRGWNSTDDSPDFLRDIIEQLKSKYSVDPKRVFLFGHSAGAVYALNLSMSESEYFAATAVHAGSWRSSEEMKFVELAKRKTPIAIFVGDRDEYFPLDSVKKTEELLKLNKFPVEVTVMKGHNHWYYDLAPDINRNAWEFLKRQSLTAEPKFAQYLNTAGGKTTNNSIDELNAIRTRIGGLLNEFNAKDKELNGKDFNIEKEQIIAIVKEQIALLTEAGLLEQQAAQKADQLSKSKSVGGYREFFALIAQVEQKRIEMFDTLRQYAELWLSADTFDSIVNKRNALFERVKVLQKESQELELRAAAMQGGK